MKWEAFKGFKVVIGKYMPSFGEGETLASQTATAVNKLVYKWYNDGDVYDNTNENLRGWANDLSSYANWIALTFGDFADCILSRIFEVETDEEYELILYDLCDRLLNENHMENLAKLKKEGSIYKCEGRYKYVEYNDEYNDY